MKALYVLCGATVLLSLCLVAWGQALQPAPLRPDFSRLWQDSAYTLGKMEGEVGWDHREADKEGRSFRDYDTYAAIGLTDNVTLAWDTHSVHACNADKSSTFDANGWGLRVKAGIDAWRSERSCTAVALGWRNADASAVVGGASRQPGRATVWTLSGMHTREITDRTALHLGASFTDTSLSTVGNRTFQLGGGYDWQLGHDVALQGTLSLWNDSGEVSGTYGGLMVNVAYEGPSGFGADAGVAFFTNGVPVGGTPLADGSAFSIDPVAISLAERLRDESLGLLRFGLHYTHQF